MINAIIVGIVMGTTCPATRIENRTDTWNKQDSETLVHARMRCAEIYPDSPCVKLFIKKDEQTYNVVCGNNQD